MGNQTTTASIISKCVNIFYFTQWINKLELSCTHVSKHRQKPDMIDH